MSAAGTGGAPEQWPEHIRARYGVTDRPRWAPWLIGALGVTFLAVVLGLGLRLATPTIDAGVSAYQTRADDHMSIQFEVQRRGSSAATCVLRARAEDGFDVGYATVQLPVADGRTTHEFEMRTAYRGLVAELVGCGLDGPPPGVPGAQYRPGVDPPEQPWAPPAA